MSPLLRLCGGDHDKTRDLTQDTWLKLVDELNRGRLDRADERWMIAVARSVLSDRSVLGRSTAARATRGVRPDAGIDAVGRL